MAVIQVGATQTDGANADDNVTFAKPTGVASGDFLVASVNFVDVWTLTPPTGWTLATSVLTQSGSLRNNLYWKVAGGSEPSSYVFSTGSGNDGIINGGLFALREEEGRALSIEHASNGPGSGQNFATPGVTQTKPGRVFHLRSAKHASGTTPNYTLSGWTEMWNLSNDGGSVVYGQAMYIGFSDNETLGAEPGVTINSSVTVTNSTSNIGRTFVVGYNPAVNASAGAAAATATAPQPSISSSGNFPVDNAPVTATANNAEGRVGFTVTAAPVGAEAQAVSKFALIPVTDCVATANTASVAIGFEIIEEARVSADVSAGHGYYGAPRKRRAVVVDEDRVYTIPRVR